METTTEEMKPEAPVEPSAELYPAYRDPPRRQPAATAAEAFKGAYEHLSDPKRWCKHRFVGAQLEDGSFQLCINGALSYYANGSAMEQAGEIYRQLTHAVAGQVSDETLTSYSAFSDAEDSTRVCALNNTSTHEEMMAILAKVGKDNGWLS